MAEALTDDWWEAVEAALALGRAPTGTPTFLVHEIGAGGESHMLWDGTALRWWRPGPPSARPDLVLDRPAALMVDDLLARAAPAQVVRGTVASFPPGPGHIDVLGLRADALWPWPGAEAPWRVTCRLRCHDAPFGPVEIDLHVGAPFGWRHCDPGDHDDLQSDVAFELSYADVLRWTGGSTFLGAVLDLGGVVGDLTMLSAIDGVVGGQAEQAAPSPAGVVDVLLRYRDLRRSGALAEAMDRIDALTTTT